MALAIGNVGPRREVATGELAAHTSLLSRGAADSSRT